MKKNNNNTQVNELTTIFLAANRSRCGVLSLISRQTMSHTRPKSLHCIWRRTNTTCIRSIKIFSRSKEKLYVFFFLVFLGFLCLFICFFLHHSKSTLAFVIQVLILCPSKKTPFSMAFFFLSLQSHTHSKRKYRTLKQTKYCCNITLFTYLIPSGYMPIFSNAKRFMGNCVLTQKMNFFHEIQHDHA